jgi:hypothetical protein
MTTEYKVVCYDLYTTGGECSMSCNFHSLCLKLHHVLLVEGTAAEHFTCVCASTLVVLVLATHLDPSPVAEDVGLLLLLTQVKRRCDCCQQAI